MANLLTILRMILCVIAIELLFSGRPDFAVTSIIITFLVIVLDGLDGYAARSLNETSKFGSVFDILGDRVVENLYWIAFAVIGWVGLWVPMLIAARGILIDGFRSIAFAQGYTAFGSSTMMQNKFCHFLTASRFSRAVYGIAKALAFLMLIFAHIPNIEYYDAMTINSYIRYANNQSYFITAADILVYITVIMCIIRGIPVLIESKRFIDNNDKK